MKIKKLLLALAGAVATLAASAASPNRVVFIGDSITAQSVWGYGYCTAMKPLMPDTTLVSLGWSGQTLDGWKNAEIDNRGGSGDYGTELETGFRIGTELDKAADYVFIMLGMNDLLKPTTYDTPESLAQWKANLKTFAQNIRPREAGRNAKICLASVSLLMENLDGPKNVTLDKLAVAAQEVVAELGAGYVYVPIREKIKEQHLAGRAINPEYHLCLDHVHPVEDGHAVIAREYLSVMGETEGVANRNQYLAERMEWQRQNAPVNYVAPNPAPWLVSTKSFSLQHAWNYPVLDDSKAAGLIESAIEGGATPETILSVDPTRLSAWTNVVATIDCFGGAGEGSICFNQIFNAGPFSAAYAARYIYSPTERVVTMNVTKENFTGCPYLAIWLNGVKVHFGQETSKSVTLKKGDNILFLRSSQPEWAWQQSVTFAASDTCPDVSDLEYGVAPSGNIDIGDATEFDEGRVKVSGASKIVCLSETDNEYVFTYRGNGAIEFSEAVNVDLLVVGGGGGGGACAGGGGGAGGVRYVQGHSVAAGTYQISVGTGGAGSEDQYTKGVNGGISSALNITAIGGGGGGTITTRDGVNGGSGGGACGLFGFWSEQQVGVPGEGSDGQGNAGGAGYTVPEMGNGIVSGGGGGAGAAGTSATSTTALGYGGAGLACSITGSEVVYGGGGGGGRSESGGSIAGGLGGGGAGHGVDWNGTENAPTAGENGVDGLGGGGGGGGSAWSGSFAKGGNGGSGVVIIRYRRAASGGDEPVDPGDDPESVTAEGVTAVGATLAYAGEDPVFTFGTNGTITVAEDCVAAVLVVGGGGGGGSHGGGGGGAGGVRFLDSYQLAAGTYQVTVGAGGAGSSSGYEPGADGAASSVFDIVAAGGGGGGSVYVRNGAAGGSGGGAAGTIGWQAANSGWQAGVQGSGTEGQGNAGGAGCVSGVEDWWHNSGGGGGAAGVGGSTSNGGELGFGGAGIPCRISGSRVYYGGGGGITGGGATVPGGVGGGGIGHGYDYLGQDEQNNPINVPHAGENGVDGLGGGGGGGGGFYHHNGANGGNGGSGVVIVRVLKAGAMPAVDVSKAPQFRYYRFKVEDIRNAGSRMVQIADIVLRDGESDITQQKVAILCDTETRPSNGAAGDTISPDNEPASNAVDSWIFSKWLDFRMDEYQSDAVRDAVWVGVDFGEAKRVTSYEWYTPGDEWGRDPVAWRLQGSADAQNWIDLDVVEGYEPTQRRMSVAYSADLVMPDLSAEWPVVDGVEKATPEAFLAAAKDGAAVVLPAAFAWDGNVLKKDGEAWAMLPSIYNVQNGVVALDAAQVRPVVGADAQATVNGIAVVDGKVKINVVNAKGGLYYGYRFATALGSLDTAPVTWSGESAAQDGDLLISAGDAGTAGFYRIVVGDRAPQN